MAVNGLADDTNDAKDTTETETVIDTATGPDGLVRVPYGSPSPGLLARADRGLARFLHGFRPTDATARQPVGRNGTGTTSRTGVGDHRP
ncbi:hypothetical protein ACFW6F_32940 [Streptomyces sp. NPDC058746]|uniref:hypothetical protein n=1 Tax=Streptomyces sp. NPDC058746 TaxID=3346622 RepID=UPI00368E0D9B